MNRLSKVFSFFWLGRTREPSNMNNAGGPSETDQDIIGSTTSAEEVISVLAEHGCADLTTKIDMAACSDLPRAGGGFCDVYKGGLNHGAKIAIKSLRLYDEPGKTHEKGKILKRAARELYHWSKLKHPNVLPLMGLAVFRGHLSMISEWMENGTLATYLRLNPDVDPVGICINVCAGLSYIHDNDMVHGDLKAANIMVSCTGVVMIADFGNSQLRDLTINFTNTTSSSLSIRWAAPELLLGGDDGPRVSKKSDVYAFGMTALETLTGKVPFEEFNDTKVLSLVAIKRQTPARPAHGVSDEIWKIMKRCWRWEQSARPDIRIVEKPLRDIYFQAWVESRREESFSAGNLRMNELAMPEIEHERTSRPDGSSGKYRERLRGLSKVAGEHLAKGRLTKSGILAAEVLAVQRRILGEDDPDTLLSMHGLALTYDRQGRLAEAESLCAEVLAARKRVLGEDHPDTLQSMHNLALTYGHQDRLAEAESLFVKALAARKQVLGEDHTGTLQSMHNLARTYRKRGRLAEAESLCAELLVARKRALREDHPETLKSMQELARTYDSQDRLAEAGSLYAEALAARKRVLGEDHPDTLQSMHNLALTYGRQDRLAEAESLFVKALAARKQVLGEDHPDTLQSMHNLALIYGRQDRFAEAEPLCAELLAARKRVLGTDHPDTLQSMHNLARTYRKRGRLAEAESLFAKALVARKRVLREDHPDTLKSMQELARTYDSQNRLAEAGSLYAEALAARKRVLGEDHPDTLQSMHNLALICGDQGRLAEAEALFAEALAALKRVLGEDHPGTLQSMHNLALIYDDQGRLAEAESLRAAALAARKRVLAEDHHNTLQSMHALVVM